MGAYANFYNSKNGDRKYDASSFEEWLKPFFVTGVFNGSLQVKQKTGMTIQVTPGFVNINGKTKYFEMVKELTLQGSHPTMSRIDNVVVRRDDNLRDFVIEVVKGNESSHPVAPVPNRSGNKYELVLAQILVNAASVDIKQKDITDTRMNAEICGWVASTVKEIDFAQITEQWSSFIAEFEATNQVAFDTWFQAMKDQLSTDAAGRLQNQIDTLTSTKADKTEVQALKNARVIQLTTSWTPEGKKFIQRVPLNGITADDRPDIFLEMSDDDDTADKEMEEYNKVVRADTEDGKIKFKANEPTTIPLNVVVKGV